ncbi:hypothetical protein [Brevibacillus daliensis]|uniref:hypothetical protein n=1 Tax=Brevibacillus daliensis TaxID=2892995 RepID=UPI001E2B9261|nr:hypothetical protein [Brevibacillus daliensis]
MAYLGLLSTLAFLLSTFAMFNYNWLFKGKFKPSKKTLLLIVGISMVGFVIAASFS